MTLNTLINYCKKNKISLDRELIWTTSDSFVITGFDLCDDAVVLKGGDIFFDYENNEKIPAIALTSKRPTHQP